MQGRRPAPRPRSAHRAALWLFALALCARAFALVHLVVEPHAVCAAHDELVHHESHAHAPEEERPGPSYGAAAEREEHDEHCSTFSCARIESIGTVPACSSPWVLAEEGRSAVVRRARPGKSGVPLLLLAPKTSPPASFAARA